MSMSRLEKLIKKNIKEARDVVNFDKGVSYHEQVISDFRLKDGRKFEVRLVYEQLPDE